MPPSEANNNLRQANSLDISAITEFIDQASLVHRNLDWRPLSDWIPLEPFLLWEEERKITALLSCAPDPEGIAWIHAFASDGWFSDLNKYWDSLLDRSLAILQSTNSALYTISMFQWFTKLLFRTGFSLVHNVIVLSRLADPPPALAFPPEVFFRPMQESDLDAVAALDRESFDPAWVISRPSLKYTFLNVQHAEVAEIDDRIIGYELSTANGVSAHLTRLAVSPHYRKANIGYNLTQLMIRDFAAHGIRNITVNTQENNFASISLYRKLGFELTNQSFPIYSLRNH